MDQIEIQKNDSTKAELMLEISRNYVYIDTSISSEFAVKAKKLSSKNNIQTTYYQACKFVGNLSCDNFEFDQAILNWQQAKNAAYILNDPNLIIESYEKISEIFDIQGKYDQSTQYLLEGLKYSVDNKKPRGIAVMSLKLGKINYYLENYTDALNYYKKSHLEYLSLDDYIMLSKVRFEMGKVYLSIDNLEKSKENLLAAYQLIQNLDENADHANIYKFLGVVYYRTNDLKQALDYLIASLHIALLLDDDNILSEIYYELGKLFNIRKEYKEAELHLMSGLMHAQKAQQKKTEKFIYKELSIACAGNERFMEAWKYEVKYSELREELFSDEKTKIISNAMTKYQSEKQKRDNEMLQNKLKIENLEKQKSQFFIFIILGVAIILLLTAVLLYVRNKQKIKINDALEKTNYQIENQKIELEKLNDELVGRNEEIEKINENLTIKSTQLEESNVTKDKFFSIIAHDLKNPITGFMISSDLIISHYDKLNKDQILTKVSSLNKASKHLSNLLENLLNWSRTQTGKIEYEPDSINIKSLIEQVLGVLENSIENKNIKVDLEVEEDLNAYADSSMINTVIRNLISNAIKFTPEGGNIKLKAFINKDKKIEVEVEDDGVGIPSDILPNLFSVSRNYSTNGTNNEKGTGLGLMLCKEFVEANKGEISVRSETGKGTCFCFTIPSVELI